MAWIAWTDEEHATGVLADVYERARARFSFVPDAVKIFSLRPEVAAAQEQMRSVLLGDASSLGARRADLIGVAVSGMNHCEYCGTAHSGLLAGRGDVDEEEVVSLYRNWRSVDLPDDDAAMLAFAEKVTHSAASVTEDDIVELRGHGFSDVNILDIVLLTAYRNNMNRVNDALGVTTERLRGRFGDRLVDAIAST